MKKQLWLPLLIVFCLSACGQTPPLLSGPPTSESVTPRPSQSSQTETAVPTQVILSAQPFDPVLQVGNTVLTLPAAYSDWVNAGAVNVDTKYNGTYLVDAKAHHIVTFKIGDAQIKVYVYNDTGSRLEINHCTIKSIYSTQSEELFYPGGVHVGMGLDELTAIWGAPSDDLSKSHEDELTYCYYQYPFDSKRFPISTFSMGNSKTLLSASGNSYTVSISRSTSQIIDISRTITEGLDTDILIEGSQEFTNMLNEAPILLNYSLPSNFYYNSYTTGGRRISVITVSDTVYVATIEIPTTSLKLQDGEDPAKKLTDSINIAYPHEIKVLSNEDGTTHAAGYLVQDNTLYAAGGFVGGGNSYVSYDAYMIPLDPQGAITPEAQTAFEELFETFILSLHIAE